MMTRGLKATSKRSFCYDAPQKNEASLWLCTYLASRASRFPTPGRAASCRTLHCNETSLSTVPWD
jgi:hypothetical protein